MNTKYKITHSIGCLRNALLVNDIDINDISLEEQTELFEYIMKKLKEHYNIGNLELTDILFLFDPWESHYSPVCEQCGDSVCTTKWEL